MIGENRLLIAPKSKFTVGQQFWLSALNPSKISICVALMFGSVLPFPLITWTSAFVSSAPELNIPLGRWYLKLLPTKWTPLARSAEAKVSPLNLKKVFPLNLKEILSVLLFVPQKIF